MLKEHEKFWAFLALVGTILVLVVWGTTLGEGGTRSEVANDANQAAMLARLRILDGAVVGLIAMASMAAQALFRTGSVERTLAGIAAGAADKAPPATGEAAGLDVPPPPEPIAPLSDPPSEEPLPEGARQEKPSWDQ